MTHRVGYVGVDHHHRDPYFSIASELPVEITAVCEPGREITRADLAPVEDRPDEITAADEGVADVAADAAVYSDPHEMLREESLDAVWITYANDAVPDIAATAIDEGVHVLTEKPGARTAGDLAPVAERASEAGLRLTPTYFYRANPVVEALRERVKEGFFGDVRAVEGRFVGSKLAYRNTDHYIYDAERSRGGALQWIGLHWVDMMTHVLDDPITRVNATLTPATEPEVDVEAGAGLQFETESGTSGTFRTGYLLDGRGKDTYLSLFGADAQARSPVHHDAMADSPTVPLELVAEGWGSAPRRTTEYEFAYERFPAWGDYVLAFFERFFESLDGGSPPADGDDAIDVLRVLDAAYESAASDEWVSVGRR